MQLKSGRNPAIALVLGARSPPNAANFCAVAARKFKTGAVAHAAQKLSQSGNRIVALARKSKVSAVRMQQLKSGGALQ